MKFTQEVKDKWVNALESGVYKKGTGKLRIGDKYCCIGVLVEIMDDIKINETGTEFESTIGYNHTKGYQSGGLGLEYSLVESLIDLNDSVYYLDKTFKNMIPQIKELEVEV